MNQLPGPGKLTSTLKLTKLRIRHTHSSKNRQESKEDRRQGRGYSINKERLYPETCEFFSKENP